MIELTCLEIEVNKAELLALRSYNEAQTASENDPAKGILLWNEAITKIEESKNRYDELITSTEDLLIETEKSKDMYTKNLLETAMQIIRKAEKKIEYRRFQVETNKIIALAVKAIQETGTGTNFDVEIEMCEAAIAKVEKQEQANETATITTFLKESLAEAEKARNIDEVAYWKKEIQQHEKVGKRIRFIHFDLEVRKAYIIAQKAAFDSDEATNFIGTDPGKLISIWEETLSKVKKHKEIYDELMTFLRESLAEVKKSKDIDEVAHWEKTIQEYKTYEETRSSMLVTEAALTTNILTMKPLFEAQTATAIDIEKSVPVWEKACTKIADTKKADDKLMTILKTFLINAQNEKNITDQELFKNEIEELLKMKKKKEYLFCHTEFVTNILKEDVVVKIAINETASIVARNTAKSIPVWEDLLSKIKKRTEIFNEQIKFIRLLLIEVEKTADSDFQKYLHDITRKYEQMEKMMELFSFEMEAEYRETIVRTLSTPSDFLIQEIKQRWNHCAQIVHDLSEKTDDPFNLLLLKTEKFFLQWKSAYWRIQPLISQAEKINTEISQIIYDADQFNLNDLKEKQVIANEFKTAADELVLVCQDAIRDNPADEKWTTRLAQYEKLQIEWAKNCQIFDFSIKWYDIKNKQERQQMRSWRAFFDVMAANACDTYCNKVPQSWITTTFGSAFIIGIFNKVDIPHTILHADLAKAIPDSNASITNKAIIASLGGLTIDLALRTACIPYIGNNIKKKFDSDYNSTTEDLKKVREDFISIDRESFPFRTTYSQNSKHFSIDLLPLPSLVTLKTGKAKEHVKWNTKNP